MPEQLGSRTENRIASEGGDFPFNNSVALATGDKWIISPRARVDSMGQRIPNGMLDYAPFDALTVDNGSNSKIRIYMNSTGVNARGPSFALARLSTKTYDFTRLVEITIVNEGASTIAIGELDVLFQRVAANSDAIAEAIIRKIPAFGRRPLINADRSTL